MQRQRFDEPAAVLNGLSNEVVTKIINALSREDMTRLTTTDRRYNALRQYPRLCMTPPPHLMPYIVRPSATADNNPNMPRCRPRQGQRCVYFNDCCYYVVENVREVIPALNGFALTAQRVMFQGLYEQCLNALNPGPVINPIGLYILSNCRIFTPDTIDLVRLAASLITPLQFHSAFVHAMRVQLIDPTSRAELILFWLHNDIINFNNPFQPLVAHFVVQFWNITSQQVAIDLLQALIACQVDVNARDPINRTAHRACLQMSLSNHRLRVLLDAFRSGGWPL